MAGTEKTKLRVERGQKIKIHPIMQSLVDCQKTLEFTPFSRETLNGLIGVRFIFIIYIFILTFAVAAMNGLENAKYAKQETQPIPEELAVERHKEVEWI